MSNMIYTIAHWEDDGGLEMWPVENEQEMMRIAQLLLDSGYGAAYHPTLKSWYKVVPVHELMKGMRLNHDNMDFEIVKGYNGLFTLAESAKWTADGPNKIIDKLPHWNEDPKGRVITGDFEEEE